MELDDRNSRKDGIVGRGCDHAVAASVLGAGSRTCTPLDRKGRIICWGRKKVMIYGVEMKHH